MDKKTDITEKYGAVTQLKMIIETLSKQGDKGATLPGFNYLLTKLDKLYTEINMEIVEEFTGTIRQLRDVVMADEKGSDADEP